MNERYKELGYKITTDPTFMDMQNAVTPKLQKKLGPLYIKLQDQKGGKKIIAEILKLIEKHPDNPQLKNYLSVAYKVSSKMKKAHEVNHWIIAEHPNYLFGKLNMAAEYFENGKLEKMPEVMGELMELQDLYPDRKIFHLTEVTSFNLFAILYFVAIGNQEAAESRFEIMEKIAPGHPDTEKASTHIMQGRMDAGSKSWEEDEKTKIKVKTSSGIKVEQTTQKPEFAHEEINILYQEGLFISTENLQKILSLPRETLISDLESVLQDMLARYEYFETYVETNDWDEETTSFGIHALYLLGELRAGQSLGVVLDILRQGEEFFEFWFGDFFTDHIWEPLYYIANKQTEELKQFVLEPSIYTFARTEISNLIQQIAHHQPERKEGAIAWFQYVLQSYIDAGLEENIVDSDVIGLMICDIIAINADILLPEIEKLYELGYVSTMICGDLASVKEDIGKPPEFDDKRDLLNIYDRYEEITTNWAGYQEYNDDENTDVVYEDMPETLVPKKQNVGRNEPCPCGSGKKYKKCCLNK